LVILSELKSNNAARKLQSSFARIVRDAYPLRPSRAWAAVTLSLLPPLLQIAVFGGLLKVLAVFARGEHLVLLGRPLIIENSYALAICAVLASLGLVLSALSGFLLERVSEQLGKRYASFCTARVFDVLSARGFDALGATNDLAKRERFNRLLRVDAFNLGRQWHRILALPLPILGSMLLAAASIYLEPVLCAALLPIFGAAAIAQRRLLAQSARYSEQLEVTAPQVNRAQGSAFETLRKNKAVEYREVAAAFETHLDLQRRTFLLQAKSHLINHLATAVALGTLIIVALLTQDFSADRLTRLGLAVVMLRIAAGHLSHLASTLTMIARFQPQTERYFCLVDGLPFRDAQEGEESGDEL